MWLSEKLKTVLLNRQVSNWSDVKTDVFAASVIGPLLFLICINDLSGLSSKAKLFADDTSFLSVMHDCNTFALELNNHLARLNIGK